MTGINPSINRLKGDKLKFVNDIKNA